MMKQVVKSPLKQVIWARIYIIFSLLSSLLLSAWVVIFFFILRKSDVAVGIIALALCLLLLGSGIAVSMTFWKNAWSKIVINDNKISVVCPFFKEITLKASEIRKLAVRQERSVPFVLMTSEKNLPYKETEKIQTEDGLIKFFLTEELKSALSELLPQTLTKPFRKN